MFKLFRRRKPLCANVYPGKFSVGINDVVAICQLPKKHKGHHEWRNEYVTEFGETYEGYVKWSQSTK